METSFLKCNIWSIHSVIQPHIDDNFYLVESVYYYDSLKSGIVNFNLECIQIPEFEIDDINLLDNVDFEMVNINGIPILSKTNTGWKIDLTFYENYKLQSSNI